MIVINRIKILYRAYFTNADVWSVLYQHGWYGNEMSNRHQAKFISKRCNCEMFIDYRRSLQVIKNKKNRLKNYGKFNNKRIYKCIP